eukprot:637459-Prorocentrum_minimum.AAC.1
MWRVLQGGFSSRVGSATGHSSRPDTTNSSRPVTNSSRPDTQFSFASGFGAAPSEAAPAGAFAPAGAMSFAE